MGVVYRARDERLDRDVAIKVLREGALADTAARERFRTEAVALSRLNHPGIATIHAYENDGASDFLIMELVPGATLLDRIAGGPLPEREVIALGVQIADALEAAHEAGVVHRDLKPGNVIVTPRGQAKVLDFGIAKLHGASAAVVSVTGVAIGTPAYMAPEQISGGRADARTDVYALAAVLYELATGQRAHAGDDIAALAYAIVNTPPVPPRRLRPELTPAFERTILRALDKRPDRRPASAREFAQELQGVAEAASSRDDGGGAVRMIAVLPLANLSGDPAQEFFSDGMTEALITSLAQIGALRVISRTSAMRYKGATQTLPEIGRELGVDAVLEGSVLKAGDRVRITVRLSDTARDHLLWAHSYESEVGDILSLQSDVARHVASEVQVQLTPREAARLAGGRAPNAKAYESYLMGRFHWNRRTPRELEQALVHLKRAVELDPEFALAYAGIADTYNILGDLHTVLPHEAASRARAALSRALEIDPDLGEAHISFGFARLFYDWDWPGALRAFEKGIALNPGYPTGHQWYSEVLSSAGQHERAIAEAACATELDPFSPIIATTLGDTYFFARLYDEALAAIRRALELDPQFVPANSDLGRTLTQMGRHEEAIAAFEHTLALQGGERLVSGGLGYAFARGGRHDEARQILERLTAESLKRQVSAHAIAAIHLGLGEHEAALDWLERAYREHDRALVWVRVHPRLDPLRGHPRFEEIVRKVTDR